MGATSPGNSMPDAVDVASSSSAAAAALLRRQLLYATAPPRTRPPQAQFGSGPVFSFQNTTSIYSAPFNAASAVASTSG